MYAGHYAAALMAKKVESRIPLGHLFIAVQFLDVLWSIFILLGIEKGNVDPNGAASKLDLFYLPYTHGLLSSLGWSILIYALYRTCPIVRGAPRKVVALLMGGAVWSHFWLDVIAHRPDLPIIGNSYKIGLGLFNSEIGEVAVETALLLVGLSLYLSATAPRTHSFGARYGMILFVGVLIAINAVADFGPAAPSIQASAFFLETSYWLFALVARWLDAKRQPCRNGQEHRDTVLTPVVEARPIG